MKRTKIKRISHRTESTLVTEILKYLQCLENLGQITWVDRLNSGRFTVGNRMIRGCRAGTPDIYVILNTGEILWIEAKTDKGKQTAPQKEFQKMIGEIDNHFYVIVRSSDDVVNCISQYGGDYDKTY